MVHQPLVWRITICISLIIGNLARWIIYHNEIRVKTKHAYTFSHHNHRCHKPRQMKEALGGVHVNLTFLKSYDIIRYSHPWKDYCNNHLENPVRKSIGIPYPFWCVCVCACVFVFKVPFSTISPTEKRGYSYSSSLFIGLLRTKKLIRLASFALAGGVSFLISLDSNKVNQTHVFCEGTIVE